MARHAAWQACVIIACVLGGTAAALSWTAQGVYFAFAARAHAKLAGQSVVEAMAWCVPSGLSRTPFIIIDCADCPIALNGA